MRSIGFGAQVPDSCPYDMRRFMLMINIRGRSELEVIMSLELLLILYRSAVIERIGGDGPSPCSTNAWLKRTAYR
jgi:hypothetical protein